MPLSETTARYLSEIEGNLEKLSGSIGDLNSLDEVDIIDQYLLKIKEILDMVGISGGLTLVARKDIRVVPSSPSPTIHPATPPLADPSEAQLKKSIRALQLTLAQSSKKLAKIKSILKTSESHSDAAAVLKMEKIVNYLRLYFETGLSPTLLMAPVLKRKSVLTSLERAQKLQSVRKKGILLVDKSKIFTAFKSQWVVLDNTKLYFFKNEEAPTAFSELSLDQITSIGISKPQKHLFGFHVVCADGTMLHFAANDKADLASWVLSIDGIKHSHSYCSSMDLSEKTSLLRYLWHESLKGGYAKSNYKKDDEDWIYNKDGSVHIVEGIEQYGVHFEWDGESLYAIRDTKMTKHACIDKVLAAKWNGITLIYYFSPHKYYNPTSALKVHIPQPLVIYSWYGVDREYRPTEDKTPTYKWTRHFLVEKSAPAGSGEWICEGDIPEPVAFMLQLYRNFKMNGTFEATNTANSNSTTYSGSNSVVLAEQEQTRNTPPEILLHSEAVTMFTKYAESVSEQIDMQRFVSVMQEVKPGLSEAELKLAFELMDSNKDSLIDMVEFCDWFAELKEWGTENE